MRAAYGRGGAIVIPETDVIAGPPVDRLDRLRVLARRFPAATDEIVYRRQLEVHQARAFPGVIDVEEVPFTSAAKEGLTGPAGES